jgi:hypothetical protein
MRILFTGGSGEAGRHVVPSIGYERVFSRLAPAH